MIERFSNTSSIINQDKIYVVMGNIMTIDCLVESTPMRHYLDKALAIKFLEDNNKVLYYGDEIAIMKYWIKEEDLYS